MEYEPLFKNIDKDGFENIRKEISVRPVIQHLHTLYNPSVAYLDLINGTVTSTKPLEDKQEFEKRLYNAFHSYESKKDSHVGVYGDIRQSNKTTNMLRYIVQFDSTIHGKDVHYPSNNMTYMTSTQRLNSCKWSANRSNANIASTTLYLIPDKYETTFRKIIKRVGVQDDVFMINSWDPIMDLTWNILSCYKITCVTWSMWNRFVERVDRFHYTSHCGYGFQRVVVDQLEELWDSNISHTTDPKLLRMVPSQFVWYIDSAFVRLYEKIYDFYIYPLDYIRVIVNNCTSFNQYKDSVINKTTEIILDEYTELLRHRRDECYFDELASHKEMSIASFSDQCTPTTVDMVMTLRNSSGPDNQREHCYNQKQLNDQIRDYILKYFYYEYLPGEMYFRDSFWHSYTYSNYYPDIEVRNMFMNSWVVESVQTLIHQFVYSANHSAFHTGIFTNPWLELIKYINKRFASFIEMKYTATYSKPINESDAVTLFQDYLYNGNQDVAFDYMNYYYETFPTVDIMQKFIQGRDNDIIALYEKLKCRQDEDIKYRIAQRRHRTYRITQNVTANCCSICMDEFTGPLFIAGCCQSIFHMSCILTSWDARHRQDTLCQCPNCRSNTILDANTMYITNISDDSGYSPALSRVPTSPCRWMNRLSQLFNAIYHKNPTATVLWICTPEIYESFNAIEMRELLYLRNKYQYKFLDNRPESMGVELVQSTDQDGKDIEIEFTLKKPSIHRKSPKKMQVYVVNKFAYYTAALRNKICATISDYVNTVTFDAIIQDIHVPYQNIQVYNQSYTKSIPVYVLEHKRY